MKARVVVRWIAHIWGIASALLLFAFAFGGAEHVRFNTSEAIGVLLFPVGVVAGFVIAWRREFLGGFVTLASLALFYLWMFSRDGRWPTGPYFFLFAAPGLLYLVSAALKLRHHDLNAESTNPT